jgi:hypothetical protein
MSPRRRTVPPRRTRRSRLTAAQPSLRHGHCRRPYRSNRIGLTRPPCRPMAAGPSHEPVAAAPSSAHPEVVKKPGGGHQAIDGCVEACDPNATVKVTLEISADFPNGVSEQTKPCRVGKRQGARAQEQVVGGTSGAQPPLPPSSKGLCRPALSAVPPRAALPILCPSGPNW